MTKMQKLQKKFNSLQPLWDAFEQCSSAGWHIRTYECPKSEYNDHDYLEIELETWSPAGEDLVEYLRLGDEEDSIVEQLHDLCDGYDADEHVEALIEFRGKRGVPQSIRTLIEDAEAIGEMYWELYNTAKKIMEDNKL